MLDLLGLTLLGYTGCRIEYETFIDKFNLLNLKHVNVSNEGILIFQVYFPVFNSSNITILFTYFSATTQPVGGWQYSGPDVFPLLTRIRVRKKEGWVLSVPLE